MPPRPRQCVLELAPYQSPLEGRYGQTRLDFNENTSGSPQAMWEKEPHWLGTYPEYAGFTLQLAEHLGVAKERLLLTNGSDEALALLIQSYIEARRDSAIISEPTFMMIPHYLKLAEAKIISIPVNNTLSFDTASIEKTLKEGPIKLVMLPSPDNPTGSTLSNEILSQWCESYPETLFVIDEAYSEYTGQSAIALVSQFDNLALTRTFSKAWGLSGLRLGYVIANPDIIQTLARVKSPYSVNAMAIDAAQRLLDSAEHVRHHANETIQRKNKFIQTLQDKGYRAHAGEGNFFLLRMGVFAQAFCDFCAARQILLRNRSSLPKLWGMIRISIGTDAEMANLLQALIDFQSTCGLIFDLDDTLVDTKDSFPKVVQRIVEKLSGEPLTLEDYYALKAEGGFNDDWVATTELLARRGKVTTLEEIIPLCSADYFEIAKESEHLMVNVSFLEQLRKRYKLGIVTGRARQEYERIWGAELTPYFDYIVCVDDDATRQPKPAPDTLLVTFHVVPASSDRQTDP